MTAHRRGGRLPSRHGFTLIEMLIVLALLAMLIAILVPYFFHAYQTAQCGDCMQNLRNLGTQMQSYADDNVGLYPSSLSALVPTYFNGLPTCPAAGGDSYSPGYVYDNSLPLYTIACHGTWHVPVGQGPNAPWYQSQMGVGP